MFQVHDIAIDESNITGECQPAAENNEALSSPGRFSGVFDHLSMTFIPDKFC